MRPIRVNADFEEVLRGGHGKPSMNAAIECLAFWIQHKPVLAHREYPEDYLSYVESHTGHRPVLVQSGDADNWWGELKNIALENQLNSKIWARTWWRQHVAMPGVIAHSAAEVEAIILGGGTWLIKRDHGMSGRGHWRTNEAQWPETKIRLKAWFADGVIVEPYYQRVSDVSALWLPDERRFIYYRNFIDERFQWRGAQIENHGMPSFCEEEERWLKPWFAQLLVLAHEIQQLGYSEVFSVDAFFHQTEGGLVFMPCSEINARRTMGWIAYQLWKKSQPKTGILQMGGEGLRLSPSDAPFVWTWLEKN